MIVRCGPARAAGRGHSRRPGNAAGRNRSRDPGSAGTALPRLLRGDGRASPSAGNGRGGSATSTPSIPFAIISSWSTRATRRRRQKGIVATYRLLRRQAARRAGQFYSIAEYDISPMVNHPGEILELGRSCVDPAYRTKVAMQLLWKGITDYILLPQGRDHVRLRELPRHRPRCA